MESLLMAGRAARAVEGTLPPAVTAAAESALPQAVTAAAAPAAAALSVKRMSLHDLFRENKVLTKLYKKDAEQYRKYFHKVFILEKQMGDLFDKVAKGSGVQNEEKVKLGKTR